MGVRRSLSRDTLTFLIHALIISKVDYCCSALDEIVCSSNQSPTFCN